MNRVWRLQWLSSWRYLRAHPGQLALAILGLAIGVAAVVSVDIARASIRQSFEDFQARVNGAASHRIRARDGSLSLADYAELRRRFGAIEMAPVLEARATGPGGERYRLLGVDALAERGFRDFSVRFREPDFDARGWFGGADLLLVPAPLRPADGSTDLRLNLAGQVREAALAGSFDPSRYPGTERLLVADIGTLAGWLGAPHRIGHVDLIAGPGEARMLSENLPARLVLRPVEGTGGAEGMSAAFELNLLALGLLALLVGAFIVFNTMRFFVLQRRRLYGLKRLLGLTPARIAVWIVLEAAVLGGAGTLLGVILGVALADTVLAQMAATVSALYYEVGAGSTVLAPATVLKAVLLGLGGSLIAAGLPALEAGRAEILSTLAPWDGGRRRSPRRWAQAAALPTAFALVLLLLPGLVPALGALFLVALGYVLAAVPLAWSLARRARAAVPIARAPLTAFALSRVPQTMNRTGAALAALILAVATLVGVDHMIVSFRASVADWLDYSLSADAYLAVGDEDRRLPPELVAAAGSIPGLAGLTRFHTRTIGAGRERVLLSAQSLDRRLRASYRFLEGNVDWERMRTADLALISEPLARRRGLSPGGRLVLPTPAGERAFEIGAVFQDYRAGDPRVVIALERYRHHWRDQSLTALGFYYSDPERAAEPPLLDRWLAADPSLRFAATARIRRDSLAIFDETFRLTQALKWLAAIVAFVGVLGALLALQLERRGEAQLLAAIGVSPRQRSRLVLAESMALGLIAGVLALPLGALLAWMLTAIINRRAFGWSLSVDWRTDSFALALALALAAALAAALYPMWRTAAGRPGMLLERER